MQVAQLVRAIVLGFALIFCSCSSTSVAEFQIYDQAFDGQYEYGTRVLDRLADAERTVVSRQLNLRSAVPQFRPDEASYYLRVGDPPLTGSIRASLQSLRAYNKTLTGLASGEAAKALTTDIANISANLTAAAGSLAIASGGGSAFAVAAQTTIGRLLPIFTQFQAAADRAEFRRRLLIAYPDMRRLLSEMRNGTDEMFEMMRRSYVSRGTLGATAGIPDTDMVKLRQDRELVAGWVILIDKTLVSMDAAANSVLTSSSPTEISVLVETSTELRVLAETIKATRRSD
ncbi:hypothetical protein [Rhizobium ruizarguesonis]|uniref:hypothetical protein n=1 Tax=Rhizobium ruizarguesonis TaxID=2081791 RepID=UPI00102FD128|nr:hypothetical protein [Rhizobium ruizarguesonis]MBY5896046.1 hypothetical protein [Rhizobium leguminosarum]TBD26771.1 hypothetical protein ELH20_03795 [Rhizobium ruizarguesonis]